LRPNPYMDQILNELGGLVLGAVPTMILFILLVIAYGLLVRRPLERILTERHARTAGAMEQAKGAIAAAEAETSAYEEKLRKAKAEIFEARERRMKQWAAERDAALEQVRQAAQERIGLARRDVEQSAVEARTEIERTSAELTARVIAAVMPANVAATEVAR
jgi:F-type H+-transporting ATPase subunit b